MREEEKNTITREKHPGHVPQSHKLVALMKKKKRKNIAQQRTVFSTVNSPAYRTVYRTVYSTAYRTVYSTVK